VKHARSIIVLDFGGQYAHLIASRIRRFGYYSEIRAPETPASELAGAAGIILSGGPQSVYDKGSPQADPKIFDLNIPVLGLCYGLQWIAQTLGGKVTSGHVKEYGKTPVAITGKQSQIFVGVPKQCTVWMSHGDEASQLPEGFSSIASSQTCKNAGFSNEARRIYALQFHPEVTHSEHGLTNAHQVPRLEKIVVNVGLGKAKEDKKTIEAAKNTLRKVTGQEPVETVAKNSIAGFKLREGNMIGLKLTLRGERMYEFMDRLINIVLPRLRDFHGVSNKAFDKQGNFSLGLTDQSVFPELTFEETTTPHGLQAVFVIRAEEKAHAKALLSKFGMPFEKENSK
jgi:GMP synthase (glutamine-hydrolysing) A subunit